MVESLSVNVAVNSAANVLFTGEDGKPLHRPKIVGSATEGALLLMVHSWGLNFSSLKNQHYNKETDKIFPFNSGKKRATAIIKRTDGSVRVLIKVCTYLPLRRRRSPSTHLVVSHLLWLLTYAQQGATEWVLSDCTKYTLGDGSVGTLSQTTRRTINDQVFSMADRALRTLCIAHRDFPSMDQLPAGWEDNPPDNADLICDGIVGIIDPLREDVKDAVKTAQRAGVMVRMITGDNINTAKAIARVSNQQVPLLKSSFSLMFVDSPPSSLPTQDCGILTAGGLAIEGPVFRNLTPAQLDQLLPRIQVMARSSPEDKYLMVTRLNGANLPKDEKAWLEKHPGRVWATERDLLLPGYYDVSASFSYQRLFLWQAIK